MSEQKQGFDVADRLKQLPPYIFVHLDQLKREAVAKGADIISFGIGDPDLPTPEPIIEALCKAAKAPVNHQYPDGEGLLDTRKALAGYYQRRFGVELDPVNEVTTLIGSKEGIGHAPLALINPGDVVAFPDPGYPVYHTGTLFAGGVSYRIDLNEDNAFIPDLEKIPASELSRIKILWTCYPHSPTAAVAPMSYLEKLVWLAKKHGFRILSDAAYADIYYDGVKPPSMLEVKGAKDVVMEFYSASKSFNMTGWRLAFAAGNRDMVLALRKLKNNLDSGQFNAVQYAGIAAFERAEEYIAANNTVYQRRRDILIPGLKELGWFVNEVPATFYVWIKTRHGLDSMGMTARLLNECGIVTTPGIGLGAHSDDHIRLTMTTGESRIREALERLKKSGI